MSAAVGFDGILRHACFFGDFPIPESLEPQFPNLCFLIKLTFIPIRPEDQPFRPGWRSSHLLTDGIHAYFFAALDNQFIVDVAHNGTMPQGLHGVAKDVPGRALDDVFYELRSIAFQALPFFGNSDALVGYVLIVRFFSPEKLFFSQIKLRCC